MVSIQERLVDGRARYFLDGNVPEHDHLVEKALVELEAEICSAAGVTPDEVSEKMSPIFWKITIEAQQFPPFLLEDCGQP